MYSFLNDYSEGAHKNVLKAIIKTNFEQTEGYGVDKYCEQAEKMIKDVLGTDAAVHFLTGGTVTNTTVIAAFLKPYEGVIAPDTGHISLHESGAIESTGHKVLTVKGIDGKITAEQVNEVASAHFTDFYKEHSVKPAMVYISQPTEMGTLYTKDEIAAIKEVCDRYSMYLYVDGARLGAALASPDNDVTLNDLANLTTAFYIGGTKMGALFGEALVINDEALNVDFRYNIKQNGAMMAKGRLIGLQFIELFTDDLYTKIGKRENRLAKKLASGMEELGIRFAAGQQTNQIFPILSVELIEKLEEEYAFEIWDDYDEESKVTRFCTSFATSEKKINEFLDYLKAVICPEDQTEESEEEADSMNAEGIMAAAGAAAVAGVALADDSQAEDETEEESDDESEEDKLVEMPEDAEDESEEDEEESDDDEDDSEEDEEESDEDEDESDEDESGDDEDESEEDEEESDEDEDESEEDEEESDEDEDESEEDEEESGDDDETQEPEEEPDAWNSYLKSVDDAEKPEEEKKSWDDFLNGVETEEEKEETPSWDDYQDKYSLEIPEKEEEPEEVPEELASEEDEEESEEVFEETVELEKLEEPEDVTDGVSEDTLLEEPEEIESKDDDEAFEKIDLEDLEVVEEDDQDSEITFEDLDEEEESISDKIGLDDGATSPEIVLEDISEEEFSDIDIVSDLDADIEINVEEDYSDILDTINLSDEVIEEMKNKKEEVLTEDTRFETRPIGDISDTITNREFIKTAVKELEDVEPVKIIDEDDGLFEFEFED